MKAWVVRGAEHFDYSKVVHLLSGVYTSICLATLLMVRSPALKSRAPANLRLCRAPQIERRSQVDAAMIYQRNSWVIQDRRHGLARFEKFSGQLRLSASAVSASQINIQE